MATPAVFPVWTEQDYLEFENSSSVRHEFYGGMVVALAGASEEHAILASTLIVELGIQLEDSPCVPVANDLRLWNPDSKAYFYPDVMVVCPAGGQQEARLVVEILSPSTEKIDREYKRSVYRMSRTILDYLIVSQDRMWIEHDTRADVDSPWVEKSYSLPQDVIALQSIGCVLSVGRIYRRIAGE
jgi:Uma2 family endonuclease